MKTYPIPGFELQVGETLEVTRTDDGWRLQMCCAGRRVVQHATDVELKAAEFNLQAVATKHMREQLDHANS